MIGDLGQPEESCMNAVLKDAFNSGRAVSNLAYTKELVAAMGLDRTGAKIDIGGKPIPTFGTAADGDGDRNMILGSHSFSVLPTPDSLAINVANTDCSPFFRTAGGLKAVARSMPTSGAIDLVAKDLNLKFFETPTGSKYFGNLMDSTGAFGGEEFTPFSCGEEFFGTGSPAVKNSLVLARTTFAERAASGLSWPDCRFWRTSIQRRACLWCGLRTVLPSTARNTAATSTLVGISRL
jgi:phosphoglucomutase